MFLKTLQLKQYRNFTEIEFSTDRSVNLFIGPNAQGKTNLLESIFVLALTKSHRTQNDKELIAWDQDQAFLYGEVNKKYGPVKLQLQISRQGKKAKINGLEQKKLSSFVGAVNVVLFAPEDLEIVKGSPGIRRRFLDMEIGQIHPAYLHEMGQYQRILNQRNNYLKQLAGSGQANGMLDIWNEQLAAYGVKIMNKRQNFLKKLQVWAEQIHFGITGGTEQLEIVYHPSLPMDEAEDEPTLFQRFMVKLTEIKEQELRRGATLIGPHRDDMGFKINGKEANVYGSQGQQRTTALSVKLAELELMREEVGEYPILLLDDVLSELDHQRQTQLINTFQDKVQTFITATGIDSFNLGLIRDVGVYQVQSGTIVSRL